MLSLSLEEEEEEDYPQPPADDKILGDFLSTWRRGLVRVVQFVGPNSTAVELETKEGPDAAALPVQQEVIRITKNSPLILVMLVMLILY